MKKTRAIFQPLTPFKNMMNYRFLLIPRLFVALLVAPISLSGVFAQESDSGQADEGTSSDRKPGITVIVEVTGAVQIIDLGDKQTISDSACHGFSLGKSVSVF